MDWSIPLAILSGFAIAGVIIGVIELFFYLIRKRK